MRFSLLLVLPLLLSLLTCHVAAQSLPLDEIFNGTTTTNDNIIGDGLDDAFDGFGAVFNLNGLSISRQINTLETLRTYRFLETFTNNTESPIATTVLILGNLGSDGNEFVVEDGLFRSLTFQDIAEPVGSPIDEFDPVIAFTYGSNDFATANVFGDVVSNGFLLTIEVALQPGESVGVLHFATLIKDATDRSNDVIGATEISDQLINDPFAVGLTPSQMLSVANFDVILRGDINCDGTVDLLDVALFVQTPIRFTSKKDMNQDGQVNLLDVDLFVAALASQ